MSVVSTCILKKRGFQITVPSVMSVCMQITVSVAPEWFWSNFVWDPRERPFLPDLWETMCRINYYLKAGVYLNYTISYLTEHTVCLHYKDQLANTV